MAEKVFQRKSIDPRFPKNRFVQLDKSGKRFLPHPDDVPGKNPGKMLWEERLAECQKTNPNCTKEDMMWGIADIPDDFIVDSSLIK